MIIEEFFKNNTRTDEDILKAHICLFGLGDKQIEDTINNFISYLNCNEKTRALEKNFIETMKKDILNLSDRVIEKYIEDMSISEKNSLIKTLIYTSDWELANKDLEDIRVFLLSYSKFVSLKMIQEFMLNCLFQIVDDMPF